MYTYVHGIGAFFLNVITCVLSFCTHQPSCNQAILIIPLHTMQSMHIVSIINQQKMTVIKIIKNSFWLTFTWWTISICITNLSLLSTGMTYIWTPSLWKTWAYSWWRHQMETFSALLAIRAGNSPVSGEFPTQRPVTRSFDVFSDLRLNKGLRKQSWGWGFETLSRPIWRHRNVFYILNNMTADVVLRYSSQNVLTSPLEWLSFIFIRLLISMHHKVMYDNYIGKFPYWNISHTSYI